MTSHLTPETVQGVWFLNQTNAKPSKRKPAPEHTQLLLCLPNEQFRHVVLTERVIKDVEKGALTFDGRFLLLKSRNTETFRVRTSSEYAWSIDSGKTAYDMTRFPESQEPRPLETSALRKLELLPLRAELTPIHRDLSVVHLVEMPLESDAGPKVPLGLVLTAPGEGSITWCGVTSLAPNISQELWRKVLNATLEDVDQDALELHFV